MSTCASEFRRLRSETSSSKRRHISKCVGGCLENRALRPPAGDVPLTERTTFNLLHKMHLDGSDCREIILSRAMLKDMPRYKPGGSLLFYIYTSEKTLSKWYLVTLLSCSDCINGLEGVTGEMPLPRDCRCLFHLGMGECTVATEAHKPRTD